MLNHLYKVEETKQEEGRVKFNLHRQKASMAFVAEESRNKYFLCVDIGFPCIREGVKKIDFLGDVFRGSTPPPSCKKVKKRQNVKSIQHALKPHFYKKNLYLSEYMS